MHVVLVAGVNPSSPRASGIRSYVVGLASALLRLGHEVDLIGAGPPPPDGLPFHFQSVRPEAQPSSASFWGSLVVRGRTSHLNGAILHAHRPDDLAAFLFRAAVRARILTVHGMSRGGIAQRHGRMAATGFGLLERAGLRSADRIVVIDPTTREELLRAYPRMAGRIADVPAGVDLDRFRMMSRSDARQALGLADLSTVAFVGRLAPEKNLPLVLGAAAASGAAQLLIAGDGPMRSLVESASFPNLKIRFLGPVEYSRVPILLNAADALALPSEREAMPSVSLESLACGTPVVATRVGGLAQTIRDGVNGFLTAPSTQDFARGLAQAVEGSDRMRTACRSSVEAFGWDRIAPRMVRVYEEAST